MIMVGMKNVDAKERNVEMSVKDMALKGGPNCAEGRRASGELGSPRTVP
jgi:hypothetical protein